MDYIVLIKFVPNGSVFDEHSWDTDGVFKNFEDAYLYKEEQETMLLEKPDEDGNFYYTIVTGGN